MLPTQKPLNIVQRNKPELIQLLGTLLRDLAGLFNMTSGLLTGLCGGISDNERGLIEKRAKDQADAIMRSFSICHKDDASPPAPSPNASHSSATKRRLDFGALPAKKRQNVGESTSDEEQNSDDDDDDEHGDSLTGEARRRQTKSLSRRPSLPANRNSDDDDDDEEEEDNLTGKPRRPMSSLSRQPANQDTSVEIDAERFSGSDSNLEVDDSGSLGAESDHAEGDIVGYQEYKESIFEMASCEISNINKK